MKKLDELSPAEILKMINVLDKSMFGQPIAKQAEIAKAIGILIKTHQAVEAEYRRQNTPFVLIDGLDLAMKVNYELNKELVR